MKKKLLVGLATGMMVLGVAGVSSAGLIVASGDSTPSFYASSNDNNAFFANILQGGSNVLVHDVYGVEMGNNVVGYYNGLTGATNVYLGDFVVNSALLGGVDLFISGLNSNGLNASELAALDGYVDGGGSVLLMGDYVTPETYINEALSYIGSSLRLVTPLSDMGSQTATGSKIAVDPLTAGVATFLYGYTYGVTGGTPLFFDTAGRAFVAYEGEASDPVPEPATMLLLGTGIAGLACGRRGRKKH